MSLVIYQNLKEGRILNFMTEKNSHALMERKERMILKEKEKLGYIIWGF